LFLALDKDMNRTLSKQELQHQFLHYFPTFSM